MKSRVFLGLFLMAWVAFSCKDDEKVEPELPEEKLEYWVKYEVETFSRDTFSRVEVFVVTDRGTESFVVSRNWEGTFGPFNRLTNLILMASVVEDHNFSYDYDYASTETHFHGRISVCRENSPFALKADGFPTGKPLGIQYHVRAKDVQ